jgi:hypothetical protein
MQKLFKRIPNEIFSSPYEGEVARVSEPMGLSSEGETMGSHEFITSIHLSCKLEKSPLRGIVSSF